jgi:cytochrome P450
VTPFTAFLAHRRVLERHADEVIARRRADPNRDANDVLGALVAARPGGRALDHGQRL